MNGSAASALFTDTAITLGYDWHQDVLVVIVI